MAGDRFGRGAWSALLLVLGVVLWSCGEDGGTTTPETDGPDVVVIELTSELTFSPDNVSIEPGTTVRWVNGADIFHTITPDEHDEWTRVEMDTADETFEHTFNTEGTFPYYCEPHLSAGMTGTIVVETP